MSDLITKQGFSYKFDPSVCTTCAGRCCTGESGYIYVSKQEMKKISKFLDMNLNDFIEKYLYKKDYKYSIKERINGDSHECVFYDCNSNGCTIYEARPTQCMTFPFWDYYRNKVDELKQECPGILDD